VFLEALDGWDRPIPKGYLKGFLDLVFRRDGWYYVVDWKSNRLNGQAAGFTADGVAAEMAKEGYFFQYLLYSVALHRFLKETMGTGYSWDRNFGGVRYYFLRGIAAGGEAPVFADRPGEALLDRLSVALGLEG
jgi:exodeoxyribonuclease V beta subunit